MRFLDIDSHVLDRVFQPIANFLHDRFGFTPAMITEFFGAGAVVATSAKYIIDHPEFPYKIDMFGIFSVVGILIIVIVIIFPRVPENSNFNPKRYTFCLMRLMWAFFGFLDVFEACMLQDWSSRFLAATTIMIWLAVNFVSLSPPPPRRFRRTRLVTA